MTSYHYNLGQYFDHVSANHAARPALRYSDASFSYAELASHVVQLCALLRAKGCVRGDVIALGSDKRPLSYALMLAALRLGIACVNIDVASPVARLVVILATSRPALVFYDNPARAGAMTDLASIQGCELVLLDGLTLEDVSQAERAAQEELMMQVDGSTIAYIMFTSGSTGVPKGVAVTHQNVLHFIAWGQSCLGITSQDNFANLSPMYFDNSVFDFYVGLFSGACLTPVTRDLLAKPYELATHVGAMACTIWFSVPSLLIYLMAMKALAAQPMPSLRAIVFGGEGYPKPELLKLYRLFAAQARLVNVYGPTECTCICSAYGITEDDFADLQGLAPLGKLNVNFDYRIVDESGNDAPTGELCLIGPNVAAGYYNDEERTRAAFKTITEPSRFMKRMYLTGDLVKIEQGLLHFLGRKDNQIKHMGYRIELEEIEHALAKLKGVGRAAAVYHRTNAAYGKLVGFVASQDVDAEKPLLAELATFLPDYMVPARLVIMPALPVNANGKVDRQALRALLGD